MDMNSVHDSHRQFISGIDRPGRSDHKGPRYVSRATFESAPGLVCGAYTGLNQVVTDSMSQIVNNNTRKWLKNNHMHFMSGKGMRNLKKTTYKTVTQGNSLCF